MKDLFDLEKLKGMGLLITTKDHDGITGHARLIKVQWSAGVRYQMNNNEDYTTSMGLHKKPEILSILNNIWKLPNVEVMALVSYPYRNLPKEMCGMKSLKYLTIDCCERLEELPEEFSNLENLSVLKIRACDNLQRLPLGIGKLQKLEEIDLCKIHKLRTLPCEIGKLRNLVSLRVEDCDNLQSLPAEIGCLENLLDFAIYRCQSLHSLPVEINQLCRLEEFTLMGLPELNVKLPSEMAASLKFLHLGDCPRLTSDSLVDLFSRELPRLKEVRLNSCFGLEKLPHELKHIKCMKRLALNGLQRETLLDFYSSPWVAGSNVRSVRLHGTSLQLGRSYGNILSGLPDSLTELSLDFHDIDTLEGFVSNPLPKQIRNLHLDFNPILESTDQRDRKQLYILLETYPQLGRICRYMSRVKLFDASTMHLMLFNRCGRGLLGGSSMNTEQIPLALWPIVLAQVKHKTRNETSYMGEPQKPQLKSCSGHKFNVEASVLYSLLQGPAFIGRCPGTYPDHALGLNHRKRKVDLVWS